MAKPLPVNVVPDEAMYASAGKIYPREIDGRFQRLRWIAVAWLLGMYYAFPWLRWNGRQAVLFDLPARKFYIFGLEFWPQDFIFLALLLIIAGITLFFFTALAGRLWCGYACPQTVWTEVFLWMERITEGRRNQRIKLDEGPWTRQKLLRKGAKQFLWIAFALWTGFTFVGFFTPIHELWQRLGTLSLGPWETFWTLFYGLATYGNAGYLREQVCKYMCPYARFQGAMFDRNTLVISYDPLRGEPRGARRRGTPSVLLRSSIGAGFAAPLSPGGDRPTATPAGDQGPGGTPSTGAAGSMQSPGAPALGDCIDCTVCVQVCPTGIDIRDGLQYECIACGACIDACDSVMDKMGYPRGLVRYSTENAIEGKPTRILRPRVLVYGTLLGVLLAAWSWSVLHRPAFIVDVLRDRNALYRLAEGGTVENTYTLKLVNKQSRPHAFEVTVGQAGPVTLPGAPLRLEAGPEAVLSVPLTLRAGAGAVSGRAELQLVVRRLGEEPATIVHELSFFGPPG